MTTDPKTDPGAGGGSPADTRFRKGHSGNPRGRPRRAADVTAQILKALDKRVAVTEGDRTRKVARRALGIARLADKFAEGDPLAMKLLLGVLLDLDRRKAGEAVERPPFDAHDREVIKNLRELFGVC
jgi:Family of unknown function (DUF5681)